MRLIPRFVVLALGLSGIGSTVWAQCGQDCPQRRTITVSGAGTVTADADMAIVRVGYKLYGPDAKTAYATATETSNAIMQALTASGIEKTAIESTSQVLQHTPPYEWQQYQPNSDERKERQFTVTQSWVIRVKPDDAGKALDTAINAGANESGWIQWIVEDPNALEAQASAKALANARTIAEQMAQKSGVPLGRLVSVNQNQGPMMYNGPIAGIVGGMAAGMGVGMGAYDMVTVNNQQLAINSRRVVFNVSVYAVFAIE
jgi:hypothetical protein